MATLAVEAPMQGTIVSVDVRAGDAVRPGQQLVVIESMKMEHVIAAEDGAQIVDIAVVPGQTVNPGDVLLSLAPLAAGDAGHAAGAEHRAAAIGAAGTHADRQDLADVLERHAVTTDGRRPDAVARRRQTGQRTARENVEGLCDPGTFVEYGALAIAAQRRRRSVDDLVARTPADGLVAGVGKVNGHRTIVMSYDYTVLAGTQGLQN
ncbi:MAG: hypothetical protein JO050_03880, partial [Acidimicrobiia bacterium]|nr:hypothetical protein [Acidimicrobiia bacterium]